MGSRLGRFQQAPGSPGPEAVAAPTGPAPVLGTATVAAAWQGRQVQQHQQPQQPPPQQQQQQLQQQQMLAQRQAQAKQQQQQQQAAMRAAAAHPPTPTRGRAAAQPTTGGRAAANTRANTRAAPASRATEPIASTTSRGGRGGGSAAASREIVQVRFLTLLSLDTRHFSSRTAGIRTKVVRADSSGFCCAATDARDDGFRGGGLDAGGGGDAE